jgi:hypothetical protein
LVASPPLSRRQGHFFRFWALFSLPTNFWEESFCQLAVVFFFWPYNEDRLDVQDLGWHSFN